MEVLVLTEEINQIAWTPPVLIASCGPGWMAKRLLEQTDINPNADGITSSQGLRLTYNLKSAKPLIDHGDMDPSRPVNLGQTLVHCAGRLGHEEILMRLLGWGDVELSRVNNKRLTPLARAMRVGTSGR